MKNIKILILLLTVFYSCTNSGINLKDDKALTSVYSSDEIKEIEKMVNYVDERILSITGNENINQAYKIFWQSFTKMNAAEDLQSPFKDDEKYAFLESLDKKTLESFFVFDTCYSKVKYQDSIYTNLCGVKHLEFSYNGKFMSYLYETGKSNQDFKELHSLLEAAGDISATQYQGFGHYYDNIDINSTNWRLLSTFYILMIEEEIDVKLKRHFEKE